MCFQFKCDACKRPEIEMCQDYIVNHESGRVSCTIEVEEPWGRLLKRCPPCTTVQGAIRELKALVFREPWLLTEGMAGAPEKAAWEMEAEVEGGGESLGDATPDGWTKEEREKIRREAEEAVLRRWGVMALEQAEDKVAK